MKRIIDINPVTGELIQVQEVTLSYDMNIDPYGLGFRKLFKDTITILPDGRTSYDRTMQGRPTFKPVLTKQDMNLDFLVARDVTPCQPKESDPEWMKRISSSQYEVFNNTYI